MANFTFSKHLSNMLTARPGNTSGLHYIYIPRPLHNVDFARGTLLRAAHAYLEDFDLVVRNVIIGKLADYIPAALDRMAYRRGQLTGSIDYNPR